MLAKCPECGRMYGGRRCSCGYVGRPAEANTAACAHGECRTPATVRMRHGKAVVNLCRLHAQAWHMQQVREWLAARKLTTPAQKAAFRADALRNWARSGPRTREWAKDLRARHEAGEPLGSAQIMLYRGALALDVPPASVPDAPSPPEAAPPDDEGESANGYTSDF